jgi:hypothetical protein
MKLLLDENLPKRLKQDFSDHEVYSIREMGWNGIKNGELMRLMADNAFHALLTFDKNLQYQQNFKAFTLTVFVLTAPINTYEELTKLSPQINKQLLNTVLPKGPIIISSK